MNPISTIADAISRFLPAYPADRVERAAGSLAEPLLWSGRAYGDAAVADMATNAAWFLVLALLMAAVLVSATFRGRTTRDSITGDESWTPAGTFVPAAAMSLSCLVAMGWAIHFASDMATQGVAITASRIVVVSSDERRIDVPASSVTAVTRTGGKLVLRVARQPDVELVPDPSEVDAVSRAVDALSTRLASR